MNIGLLWFDNGSQRSLKEKIGDAVSHYAQRFGDKPTVCYMHPDTLDADCCVGMAKEAIPLGISIMS